MGLCYNVFLLLRIKPREWNKWKNNYTVTVPSIHNNMQHCEHDFRVWKHCLYLGLLKKCLKAVILQRTSNFKLGLLAVQLLYRSEHHHKTMLWCKWKHFPFKTFNYCCCFKCCRDKTDLYSEILQRKYKLTTTPNYTQNLLS